MYGLLHFDFVVVLALLDVDVVVLFLEFVVDVADFDKSVLLNKQYAGKVLELLK